MSLRSYQKASVVSTFTSPSTSLDLLNMQQQETVRIKLQTSLHIQQAKQFLKDNSDERPITAACIYKIHKNNFIQPLSRHPTGTCGVQNKNLRSTIYRLSITLSSHWRCRFTTGLSSV